MWKVQRVWEGESGVLSAASMGQHSGLAHESLLCSDRSYLRLLCHRAAGSWVPECVIFSAVLGSISWNRGLEVRQATQQIQYMNFL